MLKNKKRLIQQMQDLVLFMEATGKSQKEMAIELDISTVSICQYLKGIYCPSWETILKIEDFIKEHKPELEQLIKSKQERLNHIKIALNTQKTE